MGVLSSGIVAIFAFWIKSKEFKNRLLFLYSSERKYKRNIQSLLSEMPFIYRDSPKMSVINDFVGIEYKILDPENFTDDKSRVYKTSKSNERIKYKKRVLILGAAGIGKTTFLRHILLSIFNNRSQVKYLYSEEKPLPIFVPLKAIDNSRPYPIYRYITENIDYFSGEHGHNRLLKAAKNQSAFLFLDGYDEMAFVANENWAKQEIEFLLGTATTEEKVIYEYLSNCRIWLTSRKEFFLKNKVSLKSNKPGYDVLPVIFTGIGSSRLQLIKNIFDKYRLRATLFEKLLDEELFLTSIDDSRDHEVVRISYNPLFLTIMCYIYCSDIAQKNTSDIPVVGDIEVLVVSCIELLLEDLDEYKARNLPIARKQALLKRRNQFSSEKFDFLLYFAACLFLEKVTIFFESYLIEKMKYFFKNESKSEVKDEILIHLGREEKNNPSLSAQLIYSGIFVVVAENKSEYYYDFPHRRFKEVLAIKYFSKPENYLHILSQAREAQISEFILIFKKTKAYLDKDFHLTTLQKLLVECVNKISTNFFVKSGDGFLLLKPEQLDIEPIITDFILNQLETIKPRFRLPDSFLDCILSSSKMLELVKRTAEDSFKNNQHERYLLSLVILKKLYQEAADKLWYNCIISNSVSNLMFEVWYYYWLKYADLSINDESLSFITSNSKFERRIIYPLSLCLDDSNNKKIQDVLNRLPEYRVIELFAFAANNNKTIAPELKEKTKTISIITNNDLDWLLKELSKKCERYLIFNEEITNNLSKKLSEIEDELIFNLSFSKKIIESSTMKYGNSLSIDEQAQIENIFKTARSEINKFYDSHQVVSINEFFSKLKEFCKFWIEAKIGKILAKKYAGTSDSHYENMADWGRGVFSSLEIVTIKESKDNLITNYELQKIIKAIRISKRMSTYYWSPFFENPL